MSSQLVLAVGFVLALFTLIRLAVTLALLAVCVIQSVLFHGALEFTVATSETIKVRVNMNTHNALYSTSIVVYLFKQSCTRIKVYYSLNLLVSIYVKIQLVFNLSKSLVTCKSPRLFPRRPGGGRA